ncbi:MAG TPA: hypothetical protein VHS59_05440 [Bacillota bacterium]|nr:hypothetical protein [Bacillota bacterium]
MANRLTKILSKLASPRLTLIILAILTGFLVVGSVSPASKAYTFETWPFIGLSLVFLLNLASCTIRQGRRLLSSSESRSRAKGSFILHLGLLILIIGLLLGFQAGFSQNLILQEGEPPQIVSNSKIFLEQVQIPRTGPFLPRGMVALASEDGSVKKSWVTKGSPLFDGLNKISYNTMGYVIYFRVLEQAGQSPQVWKARLHPLNNQGGTKYGGNFRLSNSSTLVHMEFNPDEDNLYLNIKQDTEGQGSWEKLKPGQSIAWQDRLLSLDSYAPILSLQYSYEPGRYVILGGLLVAVLGTLMLYLPASFLSPKTATPAALWFLLLPLAVGCGVNEDDQLNSVLRQYNSNLSLAYQDSTDILRKVVTDREQGRLDIFKAQLVAQGKSIQVKQETMKIKGISYEPAAKQAEPGDQFVGKEYLKRTQPQVIDVTKLPSAIVTSEEVWWYRHLDVNSLKPLGQWQKIKYHTSYQLVKIEDHWFINDLKFTEQVVKG